MITTYQIRNVLRIYGNQLKKRTLLFDNESSPVKQLSDSVDISANARRKQMLNQISNDIVSQITQKDNLQSQGEQISEENMQSELEGGENYEN